MSTETPQQRRAFAGLCITEVARATGLDRTEIYRAAEVAELGAPGDFRYERSEVVYTERGLKGLGEALDQLGHGVAAKALRARIAQARADAAAARRPLGWLTSWERKQESAA